MLTCFAWRSERRRLPDLCFERFHRWFLALLRAPAFAHQLPVVRRDGGQYDPSYGGGKIGAAKDMADHTFQLSVTVGGHSTSALQSEKTAQVFLLHVPWFHLYDGNR